MNTPQSSPVRPRRNMLIGITHQADGSAIIREPKVLKVGIGLPRGKAADVYVNPDGAWVVRQGNYDNNKKLQYKTVGQFSAIDPATSKPTKESRAIAMAQAEQCFRGAYKAADECTYPRKVAYFVFTRPVMGKDGNEIYVPDFTAIDMHSFTNPDSIGVPTEIDILFIDDAPFSGAYAMWSAAELRCTGDGEVAVRSVSMYRKPDEVPVELRDAWQSAVSAGERTFVVPDKCWTSGCPYSKEQNGKPSLCKPSGDLRFQLARNLRVGGTAFFHTSGFRSIVQLFSAVERIKELTGGRVAGIPLTLVLRSHRTSHAGQPAVQQNVSIEFRTQDMDSLRTNLIEQAWKFRAAAGMNMPANQRLIEPGEPSDDTFDDSPMSARAMAGEFYPESEDDQATEPKTASTGAEAARDAGASKVTNIADSLAQEPPKTASPWKTRRDMTQALLSIKGQIGNASFNEILKRHDLMVGSMQHDSPKSIACFEEMLLAVTSQPDSPQPAVPQQSAPPPEDNSGKPKPLF